MRLSPFPRLIGLVALASLVTAGCQKNDIAEHVPGLWKTSHDNFLNLKHDFTFEQPFGTHSTILGTWRVDGGDVVITPVSLNGKPITQVKELAISLAKKQHRSDKIVRDLNDMDKPNYFAISPDGKTMNTDKARDQNSGEPWVLTKQGR